MNWKDYFEMMIDWKKLPAYKAEPRIDSLIGYFLELILEEYLNEKFDEIIPELPIRLGTVRPELKNTKYAEALEHHEKVLVYAKKLYGDNHAKVTSELQWIDKISQKLRELMIDFARVLRRTMARLEAVPGFLETARQTLHLKDIPPVWIQASLPREYGRPC